METTKLAVAAAAIARMNQNALLARHVRDALNRHLNARKCRIIHERRISMRRDRSWPILVNLECNAREPRELREPIKNIVFYFLLVMNVKSRARVCMWCYP
jgi:hypothetical protein